MHSGFPERLPIIINRPVASLDITSFQRKYFSSFEIEMAPGWFYFCAVSEERLHQKVNKTGTSEVGAISRFEKRKVFKILKRGTLGAF